MNNLEEWKTYTSEEVNQLILNALTNVINVLDKRRGYLDNPEFIMKTFGLQIVLPDPKTQYSLIKGGKH